MQKLDVDYLINSSEEDAVEKVMKITDGMGAVVIIAGPSKEAHELAFKLAAKGGKILLFASLPKGDSIINFDTRIVHYNQLKLCGASDSTPFHLRIAIELLKSKKSIHQQLSLINFH